VRPPTGRPAPPAPDSLSRRGGRELGVLYNSAARPRVAEGCFRRALAALADAGGDAARAAALHVRLGDVLADVGERGNAVAAYKLAADGGALQGDAREHCLAQVRLRAGPPAR
jgi:predicted negative regulator of RcsB-dependent stress response